MTITKFEQSGFILQTTSGFRFAIDIANKTPLEKLDNINVDAFLVSHFHGDHFSLPQINTLNPKTVYLSNECQNISSELNLPIITIKSGDIIKISEEIKVEVFEVDHGPNVSAPVKENFGFLIYCEDKKIYFAGDMFSESGIDVSELEVDYALIPVGGFYTFSPTEAFDFLKKFKSVEKVIPMHYENTPETYGQFVNLVQGIFNVG